MLVLQYRLVITTEIRSKINQDTLMTEGLAPIRDILRRTGGTLLLRIQILE